MKANAENHQEGGRPKLILSPHWLNRVDEARRQRRKPPPPRPVPLAPERFGGSVSRVVDVAGVETLVELARQRPLSWVGIDFEYGHLRPGSS